MRYAAVVAAGLAFAIPAEAAMDARLSLSSATPKVGETATIVLRPYWPYLRADGSCCRLVPANVRYPLRLQALGPKGTSSLFRPRRTRNPYVWQARFVFATPGRWEIRVGNYYFSTDCRRPGCLYTGPRLAVRVAPR